MSLFVSGKARSLVRCHSFPRLLHASKNALPPIHHQLRLFSSRRTSSQATMGTRIDHADPHAYTGGRWLRYDTTEQASRFIKFDFEALCRRVLEVTPDTRSIMSYQKKEGGFNRVFIFETNTGRKIVAKIPFALAGPKQLMTSSEVATTQYLQSRTNVPIPGILDWSDDAKNPVGSEYIIMEHAKGVQLHQIWDTMDVTTQIRCIEAIQKHLKSVVDLDFPAYGSIYFDSRINISHSGPSLGEGFTIGPHCGAMYWNCNAAQPRYYHRVKPNQGPWSNLDAYCDGLVDSGLARIPPVADLSNKPRYHGTIQKHDELLEHARKVLRKMATDPRILKVACPTLYHPDLHKRNIFVSPDNPTNVTAIIDWQSTSMEPAFWYVDDVPDFAQPVPDPSSEDQLEPKSEACAKVYSISTQYFLPKLAEPRLMDEAFFRPFRYCHRTWADGAAPFHEELIQTSRRWEELGFAGTCPFPYPTGEEIDAHAKDYKMFEVAQQLKHTLAGLLNIPTDGWVPLDEWEATKHAHKELYQSLLHDILANENSDDDEPLKTEADLREIWPFDLENES